MTPKNIIVHHTASVATPGKLQFEAVNRYHRDKDWGGGARSPKSTLGYYITYHYFIDTDGRLIQCAKDTELRWHAGARNIDSIGICLAGQFDDGGNTIPTPQQTETLRALLKRKCAELKIPVERIYPHRAFAKKSCYGFHLSDTWARDLVKEESKKPSYQITEPRFVGLYKPTDVIKTLDGRITLKPGVKVIPGTTKVVYL